jgi:uncharacterized protein (UPF0305 family)
MSARKTFTAECTVSISDFDINDILDYLDDECNLTPEQKQRFQVEHEYEFFPENLNDIQKIEIFQEKSDNIPIQDFLDFFNRY